MEFWEVHEMEKYTALVKAPLYRHHVRRPLVYSWTTFSVVLGVRVEWHLPWGQE